MALTSASIPTKNRILTTCVQLFLKKGYNGTTVIEILREAEVSASSFQNIFHNKEGVLLELVQSMFENQFGTARKIAGADASPVLVYTVETAIQMALTELNENLRDIYLEAYTQPQCTEYIFQHTAAERRASSAPTCRRPGRATSTSWRSAPPASCGPTWPAAATSTSPWSGSWSASCG